MSKHNEYTMKEAINNLLKAYRLDDKLAEKRLINSWDEVMGKMIAKHTTDIAIHSKCLFVTLDSAALRNELSLAKTKIVDMMNKAAGKTVISEIVLK